MRDSDFQNLSTVQNKTQPAPRTVASAATIAPDSFATIVSGTAAIVNITPPVEGVHLLVLIPSGAFTWTAAGNITTAGAAAAVGVPVMCVYNPITKKYACGKFVAV